MKYFLALLFLFSLANCSHSSHKPIMSATLQQQLQTSHYGNIYFSAQPTMAQIKALKHQGFATVINLRSPSEYNELRERKTVNREGLKYYNFPIVGSEPISEVTMDNITQTIQDNRSKGKVLVHCSTSNRVGLWAGVHFYKDHGYSKTEAIEAGKKADITKDFIEQKLRDYLNSK